MFLIDWMWSVLNKLGLAHKEAKILFLGLDNAGKTTLLHMLRDDKMGQHCPTLHPHAEELVIGKIKFRTFDLGGHETARRIWKDYFAAGVDGIVYLVDAADRTRFQESHQELQNLLQSPELSQVPVCVLGNKIDMPQAASEDELRDNLGMPYNVTYGRKTEPGDGVRPCEVFMCSVVKRMGYVEAFQWLSGFLK
jgi:GTP-binding protein SAR1